MAHASYACLSTVPTTRPWPVCCIRVTCARVSPTEACSTCHVAGFPPMPDRQGSVADRIVGHRRGKHSTCSPVSTMVKGVRIQRLSAKPEFWLTSDSVPRGPVCSSQSAPSLQDAAVLFPKHIVANVTPCVLGRAVAECKRACLLIPSAASSGGDAGAASASSSSSSPPGAGSSEPPLRENALLACARASKRASVPACKYARRQAGKRASLRTCRRASKPAFQEESEPPNPAGQPASKQASKPAGQRTVTQASHPASALPISSAQQGHEQAGQQASRKASERAGRKASQQANQQASQQANQQASQPARDGASSHV